LKVINTLEKTNEFKKFLLEVNNYDFVSKINSINSHVKQYQVRFQSNIFIMENWKFNDFETYMRNILKGISSEIYTYNVARNKISLQFDIPIKFECSDKIKKWVNFNDKLNLIEMNFPNNYSSITHMYIYTNIIDEILVNNKKEQLLQVVKQEGEFLDFNLKSFERAEYHLINKTYINSIQITILDQNKNSINFVEPPVLKLHLIEST